MRLPAAIYLLALAMPAGAAPVVLEGIDILAEQGPTVQLRLSEPVAPRVNTIRATGGAPDRIYIDLPGATLAPGAPKVVSGTGPLVRVRAGQFDARSARVVLDLARGVPFTTSSAGTTVSVALSDVPTPVAVVAPPVSHPPVPAPRLVEGVPPSAPPAASITARAAPAAAPPAPVAAAPAAEPAGAAVAVRSGPTSASPMEQRMRVLERKLADAEEKIRRLTEDREEERVTARDTQKQAERVARVQEEQAKIIAERVKKSIDLPDWLRRMSLFGDVLVRHEGFYHQPQGVTAATLPASLPATKPRRALVTARNRERLRARFGLRVRFSDELSATIRLATGDPNNPVSYMETFTNTFGRKHINLDWAYLTFTPGQTFNMRPGLLSVTAGKFPNPIFRVGQMVFDDDLAPEGAYETLALLDRPIGALDQIKFHALQWTFNEVANNQDGWMMGGQVNPSMHFGPVQVDAGLGQYWWLNSDQIAQALNTNSALINTNLVDTATIGGKSTITGYKGSFNQTNASLQATYPRLVGTQPLAGFVDYVYNWLAPTDDAQGVMAGLRLGQTKTRGDWAASGYWERLGQEAAISAFTYDNFGNGGTNLEGWVAALSYQLLDPLTITARGHFTNFINRPSGLTNPTLTRFQLDGEVKF